MKFKAMPLSFTLAFVLGFLPATVLLYPALKGLWRSRSEAVPRFLLAWLIGYLAYLELISSKPRSTPCRRSFRQPPRPWRSRCSRGTRRRAA